MFCEASILKLEGDLPRARDNNMWKNVFLSFKSFLDMEGTVHLPMIKHDWDLNFAFDFHVSSLLEFTNMEEEGAKAFCTLALEIFCF